MVKKLIVPASLLAACLGLHPQASAQEKENPWKYRVEVTGHIGGGSAYNGDHLLGKGLDYGGGFSARPFSGVLRRLSLDLQMARLDGDQPPQQTFRSRLTAVNAAWHFRPDSRFQPYVLGGFGHMHAKYSFSCDTCVYEVIRGGLAPIPYYWETEGAKNGLVLGGGVRFGLLRHLSFRPEVMMMDTTPGSGPNWTWLRVSAALGFNF
jgi:opacity protein-like surface antigen